VTQVRLPGCALLVDYIRLVFAYTVPNGRDEASREIRSCCPPIGLKKTNVERPLLVEITVPRVGSLAEGQSRQIASFYLNVWSIRVSTDGTETYATWSAGPGFGRKTGGFPSPMGRDSYSKIESLVAALPEDHGPIPPRNRDVQVEITTSNGSEKRTYDAANLPEALLEIVALTCAPPLSPVVPEFAPEKLTSDQPQQVRVANDSRFTDRVVAVSHNGYLKLTQRSGPGRMSPIDILDASEIASGHEHTEVDPGSFPSPKVTNLGGQVVCEIPSLPMFVGPHRERGTGFRAAWFTPDDRHLVFSTNIPAIRIYDTRSWQPVENIAAIPHEAIDFEPSPDWKHAVVVFPSGEIDLWDVDGGRRVSRIDLGEMLRTVAWAPDNRRVAVFTEKWGDPTSGHLRVWETQSGKLQHELREWRQNNSPAGSPLWWPGGKYLLAHTNTTGRPVIGIWNVDSGRLRGALTGADCNITDPFLGLDHGRLTMECEHQKPVMWNAGSAIRAVTAFEDSLQ
jgi:WD40 repeat protein